MIRSSWIAPISGVALMVVAAPLALQTQVRFSSRSTGVVLDVAVLDNAEVVRGLTAANFEVFDQGVRQNIEVKETQNTPLDVVVVLQPMASMRDQAIALAQREVSELFRQLLPDDRAAVLVGSTPPSLVRRLETTAADPFQPDRSWIGTTDVSLWDSLFLGYLQFDQQQRRKVILTFTNSDHDAAVTGPRDVARMAELRPAQLFFLVVDQMGPDPTRVSSTMRPSRGDKVEITTQYFTLAMKWSTPGAFFDLAKATGGEVVDLRQGKANMARLLNYLRAEYLITYRPEGSTSDGWHDVSIRLKGRRGTVICRPGYWASSPPGSQ